MPGQLQDRTREHLRAVTAVLTVVSLILVFSSALGAVPEWLLPRNDALISVIPHVNVVLSLGAIVTILAGVSQIRRRNIDTHRKAMLASVALFAGFLVLYLYRVALEGPSAFDGPDVVRQFVYLPILFVHILLAVVCLPFVYYALLLAWTHPISRLHETAHARVGTVAALLWLVSFALGIVIYLLLYVLY